jgi:pilus assembly protein Flp/PilA
VGRKEVKTVKLLIREEGQGLVEYALILLLIAIVVIVIVGLFGSQVSTMFSQITSAFP